MSTATVYLRDKSGHVFTTSNAGWHPGCTKLTQADGKAAYSAQCADELRALLKPGATVHTILRHCSASGMTRRISLAIVNARHEVQVIDHLAAVALGDKLHDDGGIVVGGCGMDMGFHLVYNLGARLWPNGTPEPHGTRNGAPDSAGGYALKHSWL
jgi:hypothetical protein